MKLVLNKMDLSISVSSNNARFFRRVHAPRFFVSSLNFCNKTSEPEPGILGFGRARIPGERAEGQEEIAVGKMCQGIPFIAYWKIC